MKRLNAPKPVVALLAAAVLALPVPVLPVSAAPAQPASIDAAVTQRLQSTPETSLIPVIVEGAVDNSPLGGDPALRAQRAESRVRGTGGRIVGQSVLLGASIAELKPSQVRALASNPAIAKIHFDANVAATATARGTGATTTTTPTPITFDQTIGASDAWQAGDSGQGVTVAVLDTGIDNNNAAFGARVKARVDLVDPTHPAQGDPAGHGTHVAGIVAAARSFASPGVAPDAALVSVRVLDAQGQARLSTVIRGLEWTVAHQAALGIRVVVMALGAPANGSYVDDPLATAAEIAWRHGLVVVVAAGNAGPTPGSVSTPGIDPLLLTVGASDENGTAQRADDVVPAWSSQGPTADGVAKPDLVAPGRKIVSARVPGSTLDLLMPTHIEGAQTFRLSGTSQATAVTGGAAALLLQQRAQLSPDEVKAILTQSASPVAGVGVNVAGAGEISVTRALATPTPAQAKQRARPANALIRLLMEIGRPAVADAVGWDKVGWDKVGWDKVGWDQVGWDQVGWDKVGWDKVGWDKVGWDKVGWDKVGWDQVGWDQVGWDAAGRD